MLLGFVHLFAAKHTVHFVPRQNVRQLFHVVRTDIQVGIDKIYPAAGRFFKPNPQGGPFTFIAIETYRFYFRKRCCRPRNFTARVIRAAIVYHNDFKTSHHVAPGIGDKLPDRFPDMFDIRVNARSFIMCRQ